MKICNSTIFNYMTQIFEFDINVQPIFIVTGVLSHKVSIRSELKSAWSVKPDFYIYVVLRSTVWK